MTERERGAAAPLSGDTGHFEGDLNPKLGISKNVHVSFITTLAWRKKPNPI